MNLLYDERKCTCCGKVHVNNFLMEGEGNSYYILCPSCALNIYKFYKKISDK